MNNQLNIYDCLDEPAPYKIRHKDDFYETPAKLTEELLYRVNISGSVFEPCAGKEAIASILEKQPNITQVKTSDISWEQDKPKDATKKAFWESWGEHDWVVTNPPFKQAHLILPLALEYSRVGVAFLLRATYTEPCENRAAWLIENSDRHRYRFDINPRPQFRSDKNTDSVSCSWLIWLNHWSWKEIGMRSPFGYITDWKN